MPDELLPESRATDPCAIVIFGASGDLTHRKLLPALWHLHLEGRLPEGFAIVGMARSPHDDAGFREEARQSVARYARPAAAGPDAWDSFARRLFYLSQPYDDPASYARLGALLSSLEHSHGAGPNALFYLSTPPQGYAEIARQLGASGLTTETPERWARIIVEKPFGSDLASARALNQTLRSVFDENQLYRIDHYLGKETVQNLLVFRFANGIFEPIWNRQYVDHVQISVAEELGVESRGANYDHVGALRDMLQNHLMQVLCLVAMEAPASQSARAVRNEKAKVLEAVRPILPQEVPQYTARGQYAGALLDGAEVRGYLEEPGVADGSRTETYAALRLRVDNWRWAGVPFYIRSGKRMARRVTEVSIVFRSAPHLLFRSFGLNPLERNVLTIRIQPDEGIFLRFGVKVPGAGMNVQTVRMRFNYHETFHVEAAEAYERLLLDCLRGDITLFSREDWIDLSWTLMDPILRAWDVHHDTLPQYPAGSWGPKEADDLLGRDGRNWINPAQEGHG